MDKKVAIPKMNHAGFINTDQKDFWVIIVLSLLIHGFFFFSIKTIPVPPQKHYSVSNAPERLVKLIIKPKKIKPLMDKNLVKIRNKTKQISVKRTAPKRKLNHQEIKTTNSSSQKKTKTKKITTKKNISPAREQDPSLLAEKKEKNKVKLASINTYDKSLPKPPPKIDLKSIGILGMISSKESSQSISAIDSQLDLLTDNAINHKEPAHGIKKTLLKQKKKYDLQVHDFTTLNNELSQSITPQPPDKDSKTQLAKVIDDMVVKNQQTDTVELPPQGEVAFQKIFEIKTSGPINKFRSSETILQVASSYKAGITHCYNKTLKGYPDLKGRIAVEFKINAEGTISLINIISSTLNYQNSGLEECVVTMIQNWRFNKIPEGTTTVIYPFVFFPVL